MKRQDELNEAWCKYMGKCSTEILQALAFALRWCDEHPNWISVDDELPKINPNGGEWEFSVDVIVYLKDGSIAVGRYERDNCIGEHYWVLYGEDKDLIVTHWMPLPQPPTIRERYEHIAKSDYVKEHYSNKSLGDAEEIKDKLDCIGSDGSDPFDEVEKQIKSQNKKGGKEC